MITTAWTGSCASKNAHMQRSRLLAKSKGPPEARRLIWARLQVRLGRSPALPTVPKTLTRNEDTVNLSPFFCLGNLGYLIGPPGHPMWAIVVRELVTK